MMGTFDFSQFDVYPDGSVKFYAVQTYYLISIVTGILIIVNLIIAIMLDTYVLLSENRIGLY